MTQPPSDAGECLVPALPGPGVPLSVWPGLPAPDRASVGVPCGGPVAAAVGGQIIESFSRPGALVAVAGGCPPAAGPSSPSSRTAPAHTRCLSCTVVRRPGCHGPGCRAAPEDALELGALYAACERALGTRPRPLVAGAAAAPSVAPLGS
jgi:hypothetical protein